MKTLFIARHAKSSWKDTTLDDRDRPLNKRGKRDAPHMGERLFQRGVRIDLLISSPAKRAISTAKKFAKEIFYEAPIIKDERLYDATEWEMLEVIHSLANSYERVMLVAHNPGVTDLVNQISGRRVENMPTCGIVQLDYEIERWDQIGHKKPKRFDFDYPKKI
ncbi:histidine phosphatase family protein [candidate division KSB1 bacterium]|nr:histidine phosphatase family protein [candidate division KSB1 bacterium]